MGGGAGEDEAAARRAALLASVESAKERSEASRRPREINWFLLSPLLFAPTLPLIRIGLRHHPKVRDVVWRGTLGVAFCHSALLASGWYNNDHSK